MNNLPKHFRFPILVFFVAILNLLFTTPLYATQVSDKLMSSDDVNLTGRDFFHSYTSSNANEREKAKIYLLGVEDTTEGKTWCGYNLLKTVTLQAFIFEYFKKLPESQLNKRASILIEEALSQKFSCRSK